MESVPAMDWGEVATRRDLNRLHSDIRDLRRQMEGQFRTTILSVLTLDIGLAGLVFLALRLG